MSESKEKYMKATSVWIYRVSFLTSNVFQQPFQKGRHEVSMGGAARRQTQGILLVLNGIFLTSYLQIFKGAFYTWHYGRIQFEKWKDLEPELSSSEVWQEATTPLWWKPSWNDRSLSPSRCWPCPSATFTADPSPLKKDQDAQECQHRIKIFLIPVCKLF